MTRTELVKKLRRLKVETGSLACMGCGHEHNCSVSGCAIMNEAIKALNEAEKKSGKWIDLYDDYEVAKCSVCGNEFDAIQPADHASAKWWHEFCQMYQYCPCCGARMDGKEENND